MRDKDLSDQLLSKQTETYTTEELNQEIHKVDYSSPELLEDIHKIEQDRINNYLKSQKQETTPKLTYEELEKRISTQKYDRGVFAKWKLGNSESMKAVTKSTKELSKLLSSSVGEVDYLMVKNAYAVVQEKCVDYLTTHHPKTAEGKARKDMVQKLLDRVLEEKRYIDINSELVTEKDKQDGKSWGEMLAGAHVVALKEGEYEVPAEAALAGSSEVTKIKGKKGERFFFKTSEKVSLVHSAEAMVSELLGRYANEIIRLKDLNDPLYSGLTEEQRQKRTEDLEGIIAAAMKLKEETKTIPLDRGWQAEFEKNWDRWKEKYGLTDEEKEHARVFMTSMEKKHAATLTGCKTAKIPYGSELSIRNVATTVLADHLGLGDMIAGSKEMALEKAGKKQKGIRMDEAKGEVLEIIAEKKENMDKRIRLSTKALRQMMTLQVFDILCGQVDRNARNYLLQPEKEEKNGEIIIERITGIDNDLSFGLLSFNDTTGDVYLGSMKRIQQGNTITLMGLDAAFAKKILELKPETIGFLLGPYLTKGEIKACQDRLKGIQQLIKQLEKQDAEREKGSRPRLISDEKDWLDLRKELEFPRPKWYKIGDPDDVVKKAKEEMTVYNQKKTQFNRTTLIDERLRGHTPRELMS